MTPNIDLKNVKISRVKPIQKLEHPAVLELSALDLHMYVLDLYVTVMFCYKSGKEGDSDIDELANKVKGSLSKMLVPYFPFAGRVFRTFDDRLRELQCSDEGVPFIEAEVDEEMESVVNFTDFTSVELRGYRLLGLDPTVIQQNTDIPLPSLFVQLTRFKCGGVTINVSVNHQAADGQGMFTFMKAWSEIALEGETSIVPTHDRSQFMPFLESLDPATLSGKQFDNEKLKASREDPGAMFKTPVHMLQPSCNKMLHVKRDVLVNLKREAAENGMEVTTIDLISAHIWRSLTRLNESIDKDAHTALVLTMNGRKKLYSPLVPQHYAGNAIVSPLAPSIPPSELCTKSVLFAANIVHSTVKDFASLTWRDAVLRAPRDRAPRHQNVVIISSWHRFPIYDFNFGCGYGNPVFATVNPTTQAKPGVIIVIHPPPPSLSQDSVATLYILWQKSNSKLQAIFSDKQFLSFFL